MTCCCCCHCCMRWLSIMNKLIPACSFILNKLIRSSSNATGGKKANRHQNGPQKKKKKTLSHLKLKLDKI